MLIIKTEGQSMRPLLMSGDLVTVTEIQEAKNTIAFGTLVYATTMGQEKVIHRYLGSYLGEKTIKGDRVKSQDHIESINGVVRGRIDTHGKEIILNQFWQRHVMGILSILNQRKFVFIHHAAAFFIHQIGKFSRHFAGHR